MNNTHSSFEPISRSLLRGIEEQKVAFKAMRKRLLFQLHPDTSEKVIEIDSKEFPQRSELFQYVLSNRDPDVAIIQKFEKMIQALDSESTGNFIPVLLRIKNGTNNSLENPAPNNIYTINNSVKTLKEKMSKLIERYRDMPLISNIEMLLRIFNKTNNLVYLDQNKQNVLIKLLYDLRLCSIFHGNSQDFLDKSGSRDIQKLQLSLFEAIIYLYYHCDSIPRDEVTSLWLNRFKQNQNFLSAKLHAVSA